MNDPILIVDDSLTVRMDLVEAFRGAGFTALPCSSAAEARRVLDARPVALIVLDVMLPDADGIEFMTELRAMPAAQGAPILLLSAEAEVHDRVRGLKTGADEYIGKPYDQAYVIARACELLRKTQDAAAAGHRTVLLIDDSPTYREELRRGLEGEGYHVLTAATGEDGLRIAASHRPNAILVDRMLEGEDGTAVVRRIRQDAALRHTPCVLLTASESSEVELLALDSGADLFVQKEEDLALLLAKLTAILRTAAAPATDLIAASLLGPNRILAVDDSITYLQSVIEELHSDGYEVVPAKSGEEAIEFLMIQSVDCILLDLMMPGLSGQETCKRIKAAPKLREIPLIMLTALEDRDAMIEGLSVGADDYITKSSDFRVLKARVQAQIRRRLFENENRRIRERLLRAEREATEAKATYELAKTRAVLADELERKNNELEAFSYSVSHDLRAPLRGIEGFSRALLEDCGAQLDLQAQGYLQRIRTSVQRMGNLIDDLLELSRVGRIELRRENVDLASLARTVLDELRAAAPDRSVDFVVEEGVECRADPRLIRIVLDNLIGNAWKFTSKHEHTEIEFGTSRQTGGFVYYIKDNGAGFSKEHAQKLFKPFQRLHSVAEFEGTGIGLATVQRIVERHGGRVWAESETDKGATFYWTLPATGRS